MVYRDMTDMDGWIFIGCAVLLSLERISYWWAWRHPDRFRNGWKPGVSTDSADPVERIYRLFLLFKLIQLTVFLGWCMWFGRTWLPLPVAPQPMWFLGALALVAGQLLNFSVFRALGKTGVFYGTRFGHTVEWCHSFPFSVFRHPQYLGTLMSIWGFFVIMRYPEPDWVVLPLLETVYYTLGSRLEAEEPDNAATQAEGR